LSAWLVDTHAVLWFLADDSQLSPPAKQTMEAGESVLLVSSASIWEMAIKVGLGKLEVPDDLLAVLRDQGFETLEVTPAHAWAVRKLPQNAHRDPFDRLLAVQAGLERLPVISDDEQLDQYPGLTRRW